jgi:hypothetical protein
LSVFSTIPDWSPAAGIVGWILGDDESTLAFEVGSLLPAPADRDFENRRALQRAWASDSGLIKTAAYLRLAQLNHWHEDEQDEDEFAALETWARKHAIHIRRCLIEPASAEQIAEALSTLADVLNQEVGERTAEFIIEMTGKARMPVYLVNALFERVAMNEAGKIKPASFTRLLQATEGRWNQARAKAHDARAFVQHLEPALVYVREHLSDERPAKAGFG